MNGGDAMGRGIAGDLLRGRAAIARALGVSAATVTRMHGERRLPTFYMGGALCARAGDLRAMIDRAADQARERMAEPGQSPATPARDRRRLSRPSDPRPRAAAL